MNKIRRLLRTIAVFKNFASYVLLYYGLLPAEHLTLRTRSGLSIRVRNNRWDARIMAETFLDRQYLRMFPELPPTPVIVDVGGYLGDFTLYAAHELGAQVVVYEPTPENFALLRENVSQNGLDGRVTCRNCAVGASDDASLGLNISRYDGALHVSHYLYDGSEEKIDMPCSSVAGLLEQNGLERVDLLKIDCEGGEYDILAAMPPELFPRIDRIVLEYHKIPGYEPKLDLLLARLRDSGYRVRINETDYLVAAQR